MIFTTRSPVMNSPRTKPSRGRVLISALFLSLLLIIALRSMPAVGDPSGLPIDDGLQTTFVSSSISSPSQAFSTTTNTTLTKSEPKSSERIAICIAGTARTFHYDGVHMTIMKNVVKPIREEHNADVFFVIRMDDDAAPGQVAAQKNENKTREAIRKFDPARIVEFTSEFIGVRPKSRVLPKIEAEGKPLRIMAPSRCRASAESVFPFSHSMHHSKLCLQVIAEHEKESGLYYDWIYRTRTDIIMPERLPTPEKLSKDVFYMNLWSPPDSTPFAGWWHGQKGLGASVDEPVGEQMFISSRKIADVAFKAFDVYDDCEAYQMPSLNVAMALKLYLVKNEIKYQSLPFLWVLVRDYVGPLCHVLEHVVIPDTTAEERLNRCIKFKRSLGYSLPG